MKIFYFALGAITGFAAALAYNYYSPTPGGTFSTPSIPAATEIAVSHTAKPASGTAAAPAAPRAVLETLTEDDIEAWRKIREEKIKDVLLNGTDYWQLGYDAEKAKNPGRLDLNILRSALGKYEARIHYVIRETKISSDYRFNLDINGADANAKNSLKFEGGSNGQKGSMGSTFSWQHFGTDGRELSVMWNNFNGNERRYISNFAFKMRAGMDIGEKLSVPLMGLDSNLAWVEIGTVDLERVR